MSRRSKRSKGKAWVTNSTWTTKGDTDPGRAVPTRGKRGLRWGNEKDTAGTGFVLLYSSFPLEEDSFPYFGPCRQSRHRHRPVRVEGGVVRPQNGRLRGTGGPWAGERGRGVRPPMGELSGGRTEEKEVTTIPRSLPPVEGRTFRFSSHGHTSTAPTEGGNEE